MTSLPSVLMITRGGRWLEGTLETPPSAARTFVSGDRITAGLQVYVPASEPEATLLARVEVAEGAASGAHPVERTVPFEIVRPAR